MNTVEFPLPFVESLQQLLGADSFALLNALQQPAPVSIRYNKRKFLNSENKNFVPWCGTGSYLEQRPIFTLDPLLHAGAYYVQEASSMFLAQIEPLINTLGAQCRVLDLCAAPGGKSTLLANLLSPDSLLISNDTIRSRAVILQENMSKWGAPNVVVTNNDPRKFSALSGFFDLVLIDAPCSGEGMFRKDPAAVNEWSPANVKLCAERQRRIVADVWDSLREGGFLVYSTCTFNRTENEENVHWIRQTLGAELVRLPLDPAWGITECDGGYRFYPHRLQGEGFFMSVLQKTSLSQNFSKKNSLKNKQTNNVAPKDTSRLQEWLTGDFIFKEWNNYITAIPAALNDTIAALYTSLNILQAAVPVGERKGKDMVPAAALALSESYNMQAIQQVDVDLPTALSYLRRNNVHFTTATNGLLLVSYKNIPVGFAKKIGARTNNLFPPAWRIRMQESAPDMDKHN